MKKSTIVFSALNSLGMFCLVFYVLSARHQAIMEGRNAYDFGDSLGFLMLADLPSPNTQDRLYKGIGYTEPLR